MDKLERIYTIPLRDAYEVARDKRAPRAVKLVKEFAAKHMKAKDMKIIVSEALNKLIWSRSIQKPPRRIKVRLIRDDTTLYVYLVDKKIEAPKKEEKKKEEKVAVVQEKKDGVEDKKGTTGTKVEEAKEKPATKKHEPEKQKEQEKK